jgi:hypothetical protein
MGNVQPEKLSKTNLEKMGDPQFCNLMRANIKRDTTYAFDLNEFNKICTLNRPYLTDLYINNKLSDMVLMEVPGGLFKNKKNHKSKRKVKL